MIKADSYICVECHCYVPVIQWVLHISSFLCLPLCLFVCLSPLTMALLSTNNLFSRSLQKCYFLRLPSVNLFWNICLGLKIFDVLCHQTRSKDFGIFSKNADFSAFQFCHLMCFGGFGVLLAFIDFWVKFLFNSNACFYLLEIV